MKKIAPIIILTILLLAYFIFNTDGFRPAPAISMTSLSGQTIHTSQRNNKPLLMTFWATTCSSCIKEMPHLMDLQKRFSDQIDITGVAMFYDNVEHVKEMVKRRQLNYQIVTDTTGKIAEAFGGIRLTPTSFLISAEGQIIYQKIGDIDFEKLEASLTKTNKQG